MRKIGWFSCGAASAIACAIAKPDIIAYCETRSEHPDNQRFMADCERHFGWTVQKFSNPDYEDTWDVWKKRKYLSGTAGAPCTKELKVKPRLEMQLPDDIHVFGYTADASDIARAREMRLNWPEMDIATPLISRGLTKASCRHMLAKAGIREPLTYGLGLPNANCLPCVKATSPRYWALIRKEFPQEFQRMADLSREMGVKLTRIKEQRLFIDQIPSDYPTTDATAPECDLLCQMAENEIWD